tara:strand:+ start:8244 stop:12890 length:4647 start_codon:yes stop_codon:yes gene_type:complete
MSLIWQIIDKYFLNDPYILIKHQQESYNLFFEKEIFKIFKENNPFKFSKFTRDDENTSKVTGEYEILLYLGGKDGTKLYFGKPMIYDDDVKFMYPNEARLRNMTYGMTIHYDIEVEIKIKTDEIDYRETFNLEKIFFGRFPIMLQSKFCLMNGLSSLARYNMGECKNDTGGYFIIDGKEKVMVSQEKFANNMIIFKDKVSDLYSHAADITSMSEDASKPIRKTSVRLVSPNNRNKNGNILVFIPNVRSGIPLFIVMRALGVISDKKIMEYILLDIDKNKHYLDYLVPCVHDAGVIFTQELALQYIKMFTKGKTISYVMEILSDYFLPHMGELKFKEKALFLGHMVFGMLKVYLKEEKPTDRDNYKYKRIETPGILLRELFREYYMIMKRNILLKMDKRYYYKKGFHDMNFVNLIMSEYKDIFRERDVEAGFKKAFKGNWGAQSHTKREGVVQDLNILSFISALSHKRKLNLPMDSTAKVIAPRLLNSSQWGLIDPVDSPDGGNIGLHKHLAISAEISTDYSMYDLLEFLKFNFTIYALNESTSHDLKHMTKIFINGAWCGLIQDPRESLFRLKIYKLNGIIPIQTSISWNIKDNTIEMYTDGGRLVRPIFIVNNEKPSYESKQFKEMKAYTWNHLTCGFMPKKIEYNVKENKVYSIQSLYGNVKMDSLVENKSIIEYVDCSEINTSLVAVSADDIRKQTTYLEIHMSFLFGILTNQIMFPENNPAVRNAYGCGQSKQGVSIYNTNFRNRIDKMGVILNYGQIPLIKSRYTKYISNEEHPNGANVIVAIQCNTGYNVEDAVLLNQGSIDRGLFRTTYFNSYESYEKTEKSGDSVVQTKFSNINDLANVSNLKPGIDYSHLDENGLVKENTILNDKIAIIGKVTDIPNDMPMDSSVYAKKGQLGVVDKSFMTEGEEGYRIAKVRVREERIPMIGDKFASRCGQKGTVGLLVPETDMPFTQDGIKPDIIINPHALPSRMTIGQLIEQLIGKAGLVNGVFGDCTAFVNQGPKHEIFGSLLVKNGYHSSGCEIMYDGVSGKQIETEIYFGPTYYMRIKQMVKDKINYRARGPRTALTRQTVQGRANDGGLRIGEMECWSIQAHGADIFLNESLLVRGDEYYMAICNKTGMVAVYNESKNLFLSPYVDGPIKYTEAFGTNIEELNIKHVSKHGRDFSIIRVPYAFKLLMQELQTMNIQMRFITDDNIGQLLSMSYSNNIDKLLFNKDTNLIELGKSSIKKLNKPPLPDILKSTPDKTEQEIEKQNQEKTKQENELKDIEELVLLERFDVNEYKKGDVVYVDDDPKYKREWIIQKIDYDLDYIELESTDLENLNDEFRRYLDGDRLIHAVDSDDIKKAKPRSMIPKEVTQLVPTDVSQIIPVGVQKQANDTLNQTIDTAQQTITNAQETINTAQKKINENVGTFQNAVTGMFGSPGTPLSAASSPYQPLSASGSPYQPLSASSPPYNPSSISPRYAPLSPVEDLGADVVAQQEEGLENVNTMPKKENVVIKKEGAENEEAKSDGDKKEDTKEGGSTIKNINLPMLTNIVSDIMTI